MRIIRVHAVEHTAPIGSLAGVTQNGRQRWSWSFLVQIRGVTSDGKTLLGWAESSTDERLLPVHQKQAWLDLAGSCQELVGKTVKAVSEVADVVADLALDGAHPIVRDVISGSLRTALQGGAQLGTRYLEILPHVRRHMWSPTPKKLADPEGHAANVYELDFYRGLAKVGEANHELEKVALSFGLTTLRTSAKDFVAEDERGARMSFGLSYSEAASPVSGAVTNNKQLTRDFLQEADVPVPNGRAFAHRDYDAAVEYAESLGFPVVVKPLAGKSGRGVVAGIGDATGVRWAINQVREIEGSRARFIVEQHVHGRDYRVYVAYGEVLSVVLRRPASVIGDGVRTIAELVLGKNHLRLQNPHTRSRLIQLDEAAVYHLGQHGMSVETVPAEGALVTLAAAANISRGGDSTEVLPETHPSILEAAIRAVEAIPGLNQAGVDFLLEDHTASLAESPGGICEINTTPALMANQAPVFGEVQPIAEKLVRHAAVEAGVTLQQRVERLRVAVRAQGVNDPQALHDWLVEHARRLELGGRVRSVGRTYLSARLLGPTERVAALIAALHSGPVALRPDSVKTTPFAGKLPSVFREVAK